MDWKWMLALPIAAWTMGCGPGTAAKAVRGDAPTAGGATGGKCGDEPAPWVIDLPDERANQLETEIKKGAIVLVKYDCQELKIIRGCDVKSGASYAYTGLAYEPRHKELEDADAAGLALSGGPAGAAKFEADYKNGSMLRIDYVAVGRSLTATEIVTRNMLDGPKCDEATHFVGAMDIGAYTLSSAAAADIGAAAEVFGRGGTASSTSKVANRSKGGNPGACRKATPDDPSPPSDCRSPLQVQLFPIDAATTSASPPPRPPRAPNQSSPYAVTCPPGKVMDGTGSCRSKSTAKSYNCSGKDPEECNTQCQAGNAPSCATLGHIYEKGEGVNADDKKAFIYYKKACDAGDIDGCTGWGYMLSKSDNADENRQSVTVLRKACNEGNGRACSGLGQQARLRRDWAAAAKDFDRGCALNYSRACYYAGVALTKIDKEPAKALWNFERACRGGDERGCLAAGSYLVQGTAGRKDPTEGNKLTSRALNALQIECTEKKSESCEVLGDFYMGKYGKAAPQGTKALEYYEKACSEGQADACWEIGLIYEGGLAGAKKEPGKAKNAFSQACAKGFDDACKKAGTSPPKPPKR